MTVEVTEVRNVVTVAPVTNAVTVAQANNVVEVEEGGGIFNGVVHTIGGTDHVLTGPLVLDGLFTPNGHIQMPVSGEIRDSVGAPRATFASVATSNPTAITTLPSSVRINDRLGVGAAPFTTAATGRLQISTWPNLGAGGGALIGVSINGIQTADGTLRYGFALTGTYDIAGFNLTSAFNSFVGVRSGLAIVDSTPFPNPVGLITHFAAFSAGITPGNPSTPIAITDGSFYFAEHFVGGDPASSIGTWRGFWCKDQGGGAGATYAGLADLTVGFDMDAQTPGPGVSSVLSVRVQGTAPSIHEPPMTVGANAIPATSALIDMVSTTKAPIFPRMTTAQRDALTAVDGMVLVNTTVGSFQKRIGGAWVSF